MTTDEEFSSLQNELFRRLGRNVLNFQRIEGMLKFLVSNCTLSGSITEFAQLREAHTNTVRVSTMGILAGRLMNEFLADIGDADAAEDNPEAAPTEAWMSVKVTIEMDPASRAAFGEELRALVDERNQLIHHFYGQWDGTTLESTRSALDYLDDQRERLRPIFERLRDMTRNTLEGLKAQAEFFDSPEAKTTIEHLWLCNSPVVRLLVECSTCMARADGWLPLASAAHVLWRDLPEDVAALPERYGYSALKKLVVATDMFDIWDEPTARGFRTLYRRKPPVE